MGITDKLPLLNSNSKILRLIGYGLYGIVGLSLFLVVLGAMMGPADKTTTPQVSEAKNQQSTTPATAVAYDDEAWAASSMNTMNLIGAKAPVAAKQLNDQQFSTARKSVVDLRQDIQNGLTASRGYKVSSKYADGKVEYEAALREYILGMDTMVEGIDILYSDPSGALKKFGTASNYMTTGSERLTKATTMITDASKS